MPHAPQPPHLLARLGTLEVLRGLGVDGLAELIGARPDLEVPPWADLTTVARLVDDPVSTDRATANLDLFHVAVAMAVCLLGSADTARVVEVVTDADRSGDDWADAVMATDEALDRLGSLLLIARDDDGSARPRPGLDAAITSPFGLGPSLSRPPMGAGPTVDALRTACTLLGLSAEGTKPVLLERVAAHHSDRERIEATLAAGPAALAGMTPRLFAGHAIQMPARFGLGFGRHADRYGTATVEPSSEDPAWFLADRLILLVEEGVGGLGREVMLALLGEPPLALPWRCPPLPTRPAGPASDVAGAGGHAAADLVATIDATLRWLAANTPQALTSGPLGVREVRRMAKDVGLDDHVVAYALETALAAGLVGPALHPDAPAKPSRSRNAPPPMMTWMPTAAYDAWSARPASERIAVVVGAWWTNPRMPHLALATYTTGKALPAFDPSASHAGAPAFRALLLATLAGVRAGDAVDPAAVVAQLSWLRPRSQLAATFDTAQRPDDILIDALADDVDGTLVQLLMELDDLDQDDPARRHLAERINERLDPGLGADILAALDGAPDGPRPGPLLIELWDELATLGLLVADAPTPMLHRMAELADLAPIGPGFALPTAVLPLEAEALAALAETVDSMLPASTSTATFLGDLTVIVAGTPTAALSRLLANTTDLVSTGPATVHRFSEASVRRSLDAGTSADDLLDQMGAASGDRPLPVALIDLVREAARRFGRVQVVEGYQSVIIVADEVVGIELTRAKKLAKLALVAVAPTVLVSARSHAAVMDALRNAGHLPTVGPAGGAIQVGGAMTRATEGRPPRSFVRTQRVANDEARLELAARLLEGRQGDASTWVRDAFPYGDDDDDYDDY